MKKPCAECGGWFYRSTKYSDAMWAAQRCCSSSCANRLRQPRRDPWPVFFSLIAPEPNSGCWLWTGTWTRHGYGQFSINGRPNIKAHRFSYERHRGPVPDGLSVLHKCDVRCCVNPAHLYVGTAADNGRDAVVRGRSCFGTNNARARITEREVPAIRAATDHPRILGRQYGIAESTVRAIQKRKIWAWVP